MAGSFASSLASFAIPPSVLYHFTRQAGFLGIVRDGRLWASQIHYLNDSEEFMHAWRLLDERIPKDGAGEGLRSLLSVDRSLKHHVCVVSFSARDDDLSQWRGYGGFGDAYSIGFDTAALIEIANAFGGYLIQCVYDRTTQLKHIDEILDRRFYNEFLPFHEKVGGNLRANMTDALAIIDSFMDEFFVLAPTLKSDAFKSEEEFRLVFPPPHKGLDLQFRAGRNFLVPYIELKWDVIKHKYPIADVVIGPGDHADLALSAARAVVHQRSWYLTQVRPTRVPYRG
jgi:hypothetical protein